MTRDRPRVSLEVLGEERRAVVAEFGDAVFTCDTCARASVCLFAFDPYNLDGDCLDSK